MVQLTAQFIRTLRNGIVLRLRWLAALAPYGLLWQPTSNLSRTPLPSTNFLPLPLQLKAASSKYCSGKYVPRNTPSEYRIRHPRD